jgi:alpha-tubulin suppressor-like RCC1 family protein
MVHLDIAIRQIACGGLHTAAVTDAGTVYTWGDARAHQLGYQPHGFTNQPIPHLVESLDGVAFVVSIACGQSHTVALTDKGSLISWGLSKHGQCGHNDRQVVKAPRKIRMEDPTVKFTEVSCGDKHTAALTTKGTVWAFGSCQQGQGGFDESPPVDKLKPTEVKSLSDAGIIVTSVVCGSIHTCMVTDEGALYLCGFGEHFYAADDQNFFYRPVQVPFHEKVVQVACGQSHIICLTSNSDVYTFGSGLYGQLGQGVRGDLNTPRLVLTGKNIAQVAAGRYHSVALTSFGTVYAFGCGENGQLGHVSDENVLFPKVLEPNIGTVVGQIACGEHHTAVLTSTPWTHADPEIEDWLKSEQEEYQLKLKFIKKSNHGLVRKDLLKIQERMATLKEEWLHERQSQQSRETQELKSHIASVKQRSNILDELQEEQRFKEEKLTWAQQHPGQPFPPALLGSGGNNRASMDLSTSEQKESQQHSHHQQASSSFDSANRPDSASGNLTSSSPFAYGARPSTVAAGSGSATARVLGSKTFTSARPKTSSLSNRTGVMQPSDFGSQGASGTGFLTGSGGSSNAGGITGGDVIGSNAARCNFLRESASMVRRMKGIISESGDASTEHRLKKTIQSVFAFRKDFDTLRNLTRKRLKILEAIQRKVTSLRKNNDSTKSRRKINELLLKALKMKLSTVTIKITETEENRKNYALNIAHLKEEELERFYQLEALRKQCSENDVFTKKINEMKLASCEEASKSELELSEFKDEIIQFHSFINEQLSKFHQISQIAQQRKEKRELERNSRSKKSHEKINARIGRLSKELEEKSKEAISMQRQLDSVNERLRYFEKRFQQVASATGLTNPDAIINKFSLKEEIKQELNTEIKQKNSELNELSYELKTHQSELELARSQFQESKWKDVDVLYKVVHDSQANATHHQNECDRLDERLAYYREGMLALLSMLPEELMAGQDGSILSSMEGADMSHDRTMNLIQVLGDKLLGLSDMVTEGEMMRVQRQRDAEDQKRQQEAQNQARLAQEIAEKLKMSSMMRRNTTKTAAHYAGLEEASGPSDGEDELDDEEAGGGSGGDDGVSGDEDQEQLQRTQPRGAMPAYGGDSQYEVAY